MKNLKIFLVATAVAVSPTVALAEQPIEVLQLKYTDGVNDYIPVADISSIKFNKGIDSENPTLQKVNLMFDFMKAYGQLGSGHYDFGYPALMLGMDNAANDMYSVNSGYNWFSYWANLRNTSVPSQMMWAFSYSYIRLANNVLSQLQNPTSDEDKLLAAQALALRSFAYWNLVQTFAPNIAVSPYAKAVVISTKLTPYAAETAPLSTTTEVYDLILSDINLAVNYLKDNPIVPAFIDVAISKRYIDLSVAYGLRARYNLTMHRYAEAARDARAAIANSSARPLLPQAAARPGFNDARLGNWMWAITVNENDRAATTGIVNFASHLSTFSTTGYTSTGVTRCCGDKLYDWLTAQRNDIRNNWFVDDNNRGQFLTPTQQEVILDYSYFWIIPHANIKFDVYKSKIYGSLHAEDIPLMRIEEMYLIEAEGLAMSGNVGDARAKLTDFVRTYRNPSYACTATDMTGLQTEVLWQRRIELWGEGQAYFDILRLQLDIDRYTDNCPVDFQYRVKGRSDKLLYKYPANLYPLVEGYDYSTEYPSPVPGSDWNY